MKTRAMSTTTRILKPARGPDSSPASRPLKWEERRGTGVRGGGGRRRLFDGQLAVRAPKRGPRAAAHEAAAKGVPDGLAPVEAERDLGSLPSTFTRGVERGGNVAAGALPEAAAGAGPARRVPGAVLAVRPRLPHPTPTPTPWSW